MHNFPFLYYVVFSFNTLSPKNCSIMVGNMLNNEEKITKKQFHWF